MPFSTLLFVCGFLPLCLIAYATARTRWRNGVALGFSVLFYAWGAPRFLPIVLGLGIVDFFLARALSVATGRRKRALLAAGVTAHLSVLFYFKYANFAVAQVNGLRGAFGASPFGWTDVVLPIGISFLTFEEISYLVDVYRGDGKPARRWDHYLLFLMLFPHSIAGPIFRWKDLRAQLEARELSAARMLAGFQRFSVGLAKKIWVADSAAVIADPLFSLAPSELSSGYAWAGALAYAVQIYFDFSGYSDMAIGLGSMLGFSFRENFREPYASLSLADFWRRWHISLSSWLRDYLYIPLGGNRVSKVRAEVNALLVFAVCGLWHGAAWTFLVWGIYHGVVLALERRAEPLLQRLPKLLRGVLTFIVVLVGWVFFRARDLAHARYFLASMWGGARVTSEPWRLPADLFPRLPVAVLLGALLWTVARMVIAAFTARPENPGEKQPRLIPPALSLLLLALSIMHMANSKYVPLIYFKF